MKIHFQSRYHSATGRPSIVAGEKRLAHRVAYEAEHGPIPDDLVLDHLCRVRNCVRVDHLEPVTQAENNRRGRSASALDIGDECQNGHLIGPGQTIIPVHETWVDEAIRDGALTRNA